MDMLPQQEPSIKTNIQETRGKIPLELKEYFFNTCNEHIFDKLFNRYRQETGKDYDRQHTTESLRWIVKNLSPNDFKLVRLIAEDEVIHGLEKERKHNLYPEFREEILRRHLNEEIEKQLLEVNNADQERNN